MTWLRSILLLMTGLVFLILLISLVCSVTQLNRSEPPASAEDETLVSAEEESHDVGGEVPTLFQRTPVPKDARVTVSFDKEEYFLGENILAHFCVENTGREQFHINLGGDYRGAPRPLRFSVVATDENGQEVSDPNPAGFCLGGISHSPSVKPGAKHYESLTLLRDCRFEKPGVYRVRVSHGLGWAEMEGRKIPVAEAMLKLVLPTAEQARRVVEEMYRLPSDHGGTSGVKREPFAAFTALAYPVYLPILAPRAAEGCERALEGLGHVPTPEATETLVRLLEHKDATFARKALETLSLRLPDPEVEEKFARKDLFVHSQDHLRHWLVRQAWQAKFAPRVRQFGRKLLVQEDAESRRLGAFVLHCLGEQEDLSVLIQGLDRTPVRPEQPPGKERAYPRSRGAWPELLRAARRMSLRGLDVPAAPRSPGELILFATAVGTRDGFHPAGWEGVYVRVLGHELPDVREVGLVHLPLPPPEPLRQLLPGLLADEDLDVRIAACRVVEKAKDRKLRGPILKALASAREERLLSAVNNAAWALDIQLDRIQVLASRLDEEGMTAFCLRHLVSCVLADYSSLSSPTREMLDAEAGRACKKVWLRFLAEHGEALAKGQKFRLANPALPLGELFPQFTFYPSEKLASPDSKD